MKKTKLFVLSGLAMLTMAFAMSCSNPAGGDPTPAPKPTNPIGNSDVEKFVAGKTFTDGDKNVTLYKFDAKEAKYEVIFGGRTESIKFTYKVSDEGKKVTSTLASTLTEGTGEDASDHLKRAFNANPIIVYDASLEANGVSIKLANPTKPDGEPLTAIAAGDDDTYGKTVDETMKAGFTLTLDLPYIVAGKTFTDGDNTTSYEYSADGKNFTVYFGPKGTDICYANYTVDYDSVTKVVTTKIVDGKSKLEGMEGYAPNLKKALTDNKTIKYNVSAIAIEKSKVSFKLAAQDIEQKDLEAKLDVTLTWEEKTVVEE